MEDMRWNMLLTALAQQSYIAATWALSSFFTILLMVLMRPLTAGLFNYLPAGPTPIIFAILAQYYAIIPHTYRYRVALTTDPAPPSGSEETSSGLTFSDKSTRYFLALQLALFQWPGSLLGALVGWSVGHLWRSGVVPGAITKWRLPGWMVGVASQKRSSAEFEGLRRRLEGENAAGAVASGAQRSEGDATQRRTMGQQIFDQFQGAL
jgi:hypothetical protein